MSWASPPASRTSTCQPAAHDRRRAYEEAHPDTYTVWPDRSQSQEWECWREVPGSDDVLVLKATSLTRLIDGLEEQDRQPPHERPCMPVNPAPNRGPGDQETGRRGRRPAPAEIPGITKEDT